MKQQTPKTSKGYREFQKSIKDTRLLTRNTINFVFLFSIFINQVPTHKTSYTQNKLNDFFQGFRCLELICDKEECLTDSDCGKHQVCLSGSCGSQCSTTPDCTGGLVCKHKRCKKCENNKDCLNVKKFQIQVTIFVFRCDSIIFIHKTVNQIKFEVIMFYMYYVLYLLSYERYTNVCRQ